MRYPSTILLFALPVCMAAAPAYAGQHGRSAAAPLHAQAPKVTGKPATTTHPASTTTHGSTATKSGSTSTASTSTATPAGATTPPNPIAQKISSKPQLNARITALLPKGMTLDQASAGFRNQGQFIAALHVSKNLGCDCFKQLQADMTTKNMSLGQSIQDVKKTANATVEAQRAETQADEDVKRSTH